MGALAVKGRPTDEAPSEVLLYNKLSRWASVALVLLVLCILITLQYRLWWPYWRHPQYVGHGRSGRC